MRHFGLTSKQADRRKQRSGKSMLFGLVLLAPIGRRDDFWRGRPAVVTTPVSQPVLPIAAPSVLAVSATFDLSEPIRRRCLSGAKHAARATDATPADCEPPSRFGPAHTKPNWRQGASP